MTLYRVHIYREMRLVFENIEAESPEEAAEKAREQHFDEVDDWSDCEGETFAALVDAVGDETYEQSRFIPYEAERLRQAAQLLLEAVGDCIRQIHALLPAHQQADSTLDTLPAVLKARKAIATATAGEGGRTLHL